MWSLVLAWLAVVLIVCGIASSILGWYCFNQVTDYSLQAKWWSGKLAMRQLAILEPEKSEYSNLPTPADIVEAEQNVTDNLSIAAYFSALGSGLLGLSGVMIGVSAVLISVIGTLKRS